MNNPTNARTVARTVPSVSMATARIGASARANAQGLQTPTHRDLTQQWPQHCLALAGRFEAFPGYVQGQPVLVADVPRLGF